MTLEALDRTSRKLLQTNGIKVDMPIVNEEGEETFVYEKVSQMIIDIQILPFIKTQKCLG